MTTVRIASHGSHQPRPWLWLLLLPVLVVLTSAHVAAQTGFDARRDSVLRVFSLPAQPASWASALALLSADTTQDRGVAMLRTLVATPQRFAMDRMWMMAVLVSQPVRVPDDVRARCRAVWAGEQVLPAWVEHERVAWYTASLLAAGLFGPDQTWSCGRSSTAVEADAQGFLMDWMTGVATRGLGEFDSPTFMPVFLTCMQLLRDHAGDADLRHAADVMTTWLMADVVHDDLGGIHAGAHARDASATVARPAVSGMSALLWLFFGEGAPVFSAEQTIAVQSAWRSPPVLQELTSGPQPSFEATEARPVGAWAMDDGDVVVKRLYRTARYAVGSIPGRIVSPLEQHTWGINWIGTGGDRAVFSLHPYAAAGVAGLVPLARPIRMRAVEALDPFFLIPQKLTGASPFERIHQHRNTVVALYDVPPDIYFPLVNVVLPLECRSFDVDTLSTAWIFIDADSTYIAIHPMGAFRIVDQPQMRRITMGPGRSGLIVQVADASEAGSYAAFQNRVTRTDPVSGVTLAKGTGRYRTMFGDALQWTWDAMTINGAARDERRDMLFDSRWMQCRRGTGILTITSPADTLRLTFPLSGSRH